MPYSYSATSHEFDGKETIVVGVTDNAKPSRINEVSDALKTAIMNSQADLIISSAQSKFASDLGFTTKSLNKSISTSSLKDYYSHYFWVYYNQSGLTLTHPSLFYNTSAYSTDIDLRQEHYKAGATDSGGGSGVTMYSIFDYPVATASSGLTNSIQTGALVKIQGTDDSGTITGTSYNNSVTPIIYGSTSTHGVIVTPAHAWLKISSGNYQAYDNSGKITKNTLIAYANNEINVGQAGYGSVNPNEYLQIYADWDNDGELHTDYYTDFYNTSRQGSYDCIPASESCYYTPNSAMGMVKGDWLLPEMDVYVYENDILINKYKTDANGKIYPDLVNGSYYKFVLNYLNYNETFYLYWNETGGNTKNLNTIGIIYTDASDGSGEPLKESGIEYTVYDSATPTINKTKESNADGWTWFYVKPESSLKQYSLVASKQNFVVINYPNQNKTMSYPQGLIHLSVKLNPSSFFLYNLDGEQGKVTAYTVGGTKGVTVGQLVDSIKFKMYSRTQGFINSGDVQVLNVKIVDDDGVCNEESLASKVWIDNLADYLKYVELPTGCSYVNGASGEWIYCTGTAEPPYTDYFTAGSDIVTGGKAWYLSQGFYINEGKGLTLESKYSTSPYDSSDTYCVSREDWGGCYLDYSCSRATTNKVIVTALVGGETVTASGTFSVTQGNMDFLEPYGYQTSGSTQTLYFPVVLGNGLSGDDLSLSCSNKITYADGSAETLTGTNKYDGVRNIQEFYLTPNASQNATQYNYNITCSANGFTTKSKTGTVYISNYKLVKPYDCHIVPSIFPNGTTVRAVCETATQEGVKNITIQVDTDMGAGETLVTIPLYSKTKASDGTYYRSYEKNINFTNTADGNSYTVNFKINGNGYYPNTTVSDTITIDNSQALVSIQGASIDASGTSLKTQVAFTGTGYNKASVDCYSKYYYDLWKAGSIDDLEYSKHHRLLNFGSTSPYVKQISDNEFTIDADLSLKYCNANDSNYQDCRNGIDILTKSSDTIVCNWKVNYESISVNKTYTYTDTELLQMFTSPTKFAEGVLQFLMIPAIFVLFLLVLLIKLAGNKS